MVLVGTRPAVSFTDPPLVDFLSNALTEYTKNKKVGIQRIHCFFFLPKIKRQHFFPETQLLVLRPSGVAALRGILQLLTSSSHVSGDGTRQDLDHDLLTSRFDSEEAQL